MTIRNVTDLRTPIGEFLQEAAPDGILLETEAQMRYAVIPIDDDVLDFLIERSPRFIESCRQIRDRMRGGQYHEHEEVKSLLRGE
jgi:hypothetical protein